MVRWLIDWSIDYVILGSSRLVSSYAGKCGVGHVADVRWDWPAHPSSSCLHDQRPPSLPLCLVSIYVYVHIVSASRNAVVSFSLSFKLLGSSLIITIKNIRAWGWQIPFARAFQRPGSKRQGAEFCSIRGMLIKKPISAPFSTLAFLKHQRNGYLTWLDLNS